MARRRGGVRRTDPSTSVEGADSIDATKLCFDAWVALKRHGGWMNYFQWSEYSGIKYASLTPRGKDLWLAGLVERRKEPGRNDKGEIKNLLHFRAILPPTISLDVAQPHIPKQPHGGLFSPENYRGENK
jgi:hypothetical protein